jgi:hypothetical protein
MQGTNKTLSGALKAIREWDDAEHVKRPTTRDKRTHKRASKAALKRELETYRR